MSIKWHAPVRTIVSSQLGAAPKTWIVKMACGHSRIVAGETCPTTAACGNCQRASNQPKKR